MGDTKLGRCRGARDANLEKPALKLPTFKIILSFSEMASTSSALLSRKAEGRRLGTPGAETAGHPHQKRTFCLIPVSFLPMDEHWAPYGPPMAREVANMATECSGTLAPAARRRPARNA